MQTVIKPSRRLIASFVHHFQGFTSAEDTLRGASWDYASNAIRGGLKIGKAEPRSERVHIIEVVGYTFPQIIDEISRIRKCRLAHPADVVEVLDWNRHYQAERPVYALGGYATVDGAKLFLYFDCMQGDGTDGRSSHNMMLGPDAPDCWTNDQVILDPIYVVVLGDYH